MFLIEHKQALDNRLKIIDSCFDKEILSSSRKKLVNKHTLNEGMISYLWQTWCFFCKSVILTSVTNGVTKNGLSTTSIYASLDRKQLITLARCFGNGKPCPSVVAFANDWMDVTWGDASKLNGIVSGFSPTNATSLISSFGLLNQISLLQRCRNACAHINNYTINEVKSAKVLYSDNDMKHPSDIMYWVNPSTKDFVWKSWIDEIDIVSSLAIE
ncbi:hypothetical protein [Pantoea ananatis]|uniref:hypothetical protein n=1 Tax=Pantoea ananas TaxID=553 RepID=UPI000D8F09F8|nr:hypothetical protein [Pantoea ananatis]PXV97552.1 hypothetical protein C7422_11222 [Pantoea ananatis]